MQTLEIVFEELPSYRSANGFWSGMHNGTAEISYTRDGEWLVSAIHLDCDNRKFGKEAKSELTEISQAYDRELWAGLTDALHRFYGSQIDERISLKLYESGVRFKSDRQLHSTLNSVQQGVESVARQ